MPKRRKRHWIEGTVGLLMVLCAAGCVWLNPEPVYTANVNEVVIVVEPNTDDSVYEVMGIFGVNGILCGGRGGGNADRSKLEYAIDALRLEPKDFPIKSDLSTFTVDFYLATVNDHAIDFDNPTEGMVPVAGTLAFPVAYGNVYRVSITGSAEKGYKANYLGTDDKSEKGSVKE